MRILTRAALVLLAISLTACNAAHGPVLDRGAKPTGVDGTISGIVRMAGGGVGAERHAFVQVPARGERRERLRVRLAQLRRPERQRGAEEQGKLGCRDAVVGVSPQHHLGAERGIGEAVDARRGPRRVDRDPRVEPDAQLPTAGEADPRLGAEAMQQAVEVEASGELRDVPLAEHLAAITAVADRRGLASLREALRQRYPQGAGH